MSAASPEVLKRLREEHAARPPVKKTKGGYGKVGGFFKNIGKAMIGKGGGNKPPQAATGAGPSDEQRQKMQDIFKAKGPGGPFGRMKRVQDYGKSLQPQTANGPGIARPERKFQPSINRTPVGIAPSNPAPVNRRKFGGGGPINKSGPFGKMRSNPAGSRFGM